MKKLINLLTVLVMVSVNVFTPFSYAGVETGALVGLGEPVIDQPLINEPVNENSEFGSGVDNGLEVPLSDDLQVGSGVDDNIEIPVIDNPQIESGVDINIETPIIENQKIGSGVDDNILDFFLENSHFKSGLDSKVIVDEQLLVSLFSGNNLSGENINEISGLDLNKEELQKMDVNVYTVSFVTNGGSPKDSITVTGGSKLKISDTKYSHTSNVNDDGSTNLTYYPNGEDYTEVISIPGAETLHVTLKYQTESTSWDWVCVWQGSHQNYTANSDYSSAIGGKLGGSTMTTKEYDIVGDSVTFGFVSDSSVNNYYGYYAIIEGEGNILGDAPIRKGSIFSGWYTSGGVLWDVNNDLVESDITLYAHWDCDFGYEKSDDGNSCVEIEYSTEIEGNDYTRNNFKYKVLNVGKYTIMDRNLGAKEPWDGVTNWTTNTSLNLDSYGYYYQWGNNFGFKQSTQDIGYLEDITIPLDKIPSKYSTGNYFYLKRWPAYTDDLRGDVTNIQSARKGPCPEGWHIPSKDEWIGIYNEWLSDPNRTVTTDSEVGANFAKDLLLPPQGYKSTRIGASQDLWSVNRLGVYYTSTPINQDSSIFSSANTGQSAYSVTVMQGEVRNGRGDYRYKLNALRCMKDFPSVIITYHPDGGKLSSKYQEVLRGEEIGEMPIPTKDNNRFLGWYYDEDGTQAFDSSTDLSSDIDLFAKWGCQIGTVKADDGSCVRIDNNEYTAQLSGNNEQNNIFKYKTIQIGEYIIMDRDLGALTSTGKGYWYQWGNNYGFENITPMSSASVSISDDKIPSKYSSGVWNTNAQWTTEKNLWGDTSGTDIARQGPCPEGWHVPSITERNRIYDEWNGSSEKNTAYETVYYNFVRDLNLHYNGYMSNGGNIGWETSSYNGSSWTLLAKYWTSSPTTYVGQMSALTITMGYKSQSSIDTSNGYPVRCFKNAPLYTLRLHTNGGIIFEPEEQQIQKGISKSLPTPTTGNDNYIFNGWYLNENFTGSRIYSVTMGSDIDLYAKWSYVCSIKFHANNQTFNNKIIEGNNLVNLAPTTFTDGYIVGGWYLDSNYTQKYDITKPITGNMDLYATGFQYGTIVVEDPDNAANSGFIIMDRNLGAFEAGTGVNSYGYHYQWGNNYGFPNTGEVQYASTKLPWDSRYDNKGFYQTGYYSSSSFWSDNVYHTGVWGGSGDNLGNNRGLDNIAQTVTGRQGPCPEGWHVPSAGEWSKLMEYWKKKYRGDALSYVSTDNNLNYYSFTSSEGRQQFFDDLKLPFAGYRSSYSSTYDYNAYYRSSTPIYNSNAYMFYGSNNGTSFYSYQYNGYYYGSPIRCFKNEYNPVIHIVKFETNGGESMSDIAVVEGKSLNPKGDPNNFGSFFKGWYKDRELTQLYDMTAPVNEDMTLYAKWDNSFGTISISDPDNINSGFTIMDRNLGALESGTGKNSYGYMYQWGNNYGFLSNPGDVNTTMQFVEWDSGYDNKGYYGTQFVVNYNSQGDYWRDGQLHNGLWGGSGDNSGNNRGFDNMVQTVTGRQGPCPEGYHVPSIGEWGQALKYWADTYGKHKGVEISVSIGSDLLYSLGGWMGDDFQQYFLLPYAGHYQISSNNIRHEKGNPSGYYRTSSTKGQYGVALWIAKSAINPNNIYTRDYGLSIRCFANNYEIPNTYILSLESNGGDEIENKEIRENHKLIGLPNIEREHSKFEGWYLDDKFTQEYDFNELIDRDLKFYAKWSCDIGYQLSDDYQSCEPISVKFYANGGKFGDSGKTINVVNTITNKISSDEVKISHTPNISDDGTMNGNHDFGLSTNEVITIPGAEKLDIRITYGSYYNESNYNISNWLSVWTGSQPGYTAYNNYSTSFVGNNGRLGGGNHSASSNTVKYEVDGDTVTFGFRSSAYNYGGDRYGYYAVITEPERYEIYYDGNAFDNILEPTREGYIFSGWYLDNGTFESKFDKTSVSTGEITKVYARRICDGICENEQENNNSSKSNSSGSGRKFPSTSNISTLEIIDKLEEHNSAADKQNISQIVDADTDSLSEGQKGGKDNNQNSIQYTQEQKDAYSFAKSNGITTTSTIKDAKMNSNITRIEMAKMLSYYAINVLGKTPDTSKTIKFKDVSSKKDKQYNNGVTLAYQLGIMGQNVKNNEFRPNDEVTRAELVTSLSRMLYGTPEGTNKGTSKYYEPHMAKLYNEGIITDTDPNLKEKRGYLMTMLMRSVSK